MSNVSKFGECTCGCELEPVYYTREQLVSGPYGLYKTGYKCKAVDVLVCPYCFKEYCCDDSFDGPWYKD